MTNEAIARLAEEIDEAIIMSTIIFILHLNIMPRIMTAKDDGDKYTIYMSILSSWMSVSLEDSSCLLFLE